MYSAHVCVNKKFLFALCGFSLVCIVCLIQTTSQNHIEYFIRTLYNKTRVAHLSGEVWSWKCQSNMCVRQKFSNKTDYSLETCNMLCGKPSLWPMPQNVTQTSKETIKFHPEQLYFESKAPIEVKPFLNEAFISFNENVHSLIEDAKSLNVPPSKFIVRVEVVSNSLDLFLDTKEDYTLRIFKSEPNLIADISANTYYGARHGLETLNQLIWWDSLDRSLKVLADIYIHDEPKFAYRGLMVDTARNYFTIEKLKKVVLGMAANKLNVFHWHITDTQSFPLKTDRTKIFAQYGAYSPDQVYTTKDIRDFVAFAKVRGVRVILEVDAPAHVNRGWEFGPEENLGDLVLCGNLMSGQLNPQNAAVFPLLADIYEDIAQLNTNNEIFHIGGDEVEERCWRQKLGANVDTKRVWGSFMRSMFNMVKKANNNTNPKHFVTWSSPLTENPYLQQYLNNSNVVIQHWLGNVDDVVSSKYKIIFSTVGQWYLDCGFGKWRNSARAVCDPYTTWHKFYLYTPWDDNNCESQTLGGEVCLWSEQVEEDALENRIWPRSAAFAERIWTDPSSNWMNNRVEQDVYVRLDTQRKRMLSRGLKSEGLWPQFCLQNPTMCA